MIDVTGRHRAEEELAKANAELEKRVAKRTAQLQRTVDTLQEEIESRQMAEKDLRRRGEQLSALTMELTLAEQRERHRLARLLHDGLQQILVASRLHLEGMGRCKEPMARECAERVSELISDAIEASRLLTADLSPPVLHEGGLLPALEWLSRWMRTRHNLGVSVDVRGTVGPMPDSLNVLLFQAVRELLFNVVKHSHTRSARVEMHGEQDRLQIRVSDEGKGFDPTRLSDENGQLSGFGLFGLGERLNTINCSVDVDSAPGKGCRVTISVPLGGQAEEYADGQRAGGESPKVSIYLPRPGRERPADTDSRIRVALVDDHMIVRQGLETIIEAQDDMAVVGEASDGEAGIRLIDQAHPDVLLMDISMPGLDGVQATRMIHEQFPDVGIIGLSMFEEVEKADAMRQAGACNYLTKSGPAEMLIAAIRNAGAQSVAARNATPSA